MNRVLSKLVYISFLYFALLSLAIGKPVEEVVVAGTGDSQLLLRALASRFQEIHPQIKVIVPDSVGSSGGIKAVAKGKSDLGRVARPIKEKEKKYALKYKRFAESPVVFTVNPSVTGVENITYAQVVDIYSGKLKNWKYLGGSEHKIYPVNREVGDSSRSVLEKNIAGFNQIKENIAKVFYTTQEAKAALVEHNHTIGYTALSAVPGTGLKILKLEGFYPDSKNIKSNNYKLSTPFGIVYRDDLKDSAKQFLDFLWSDEAKKIIKAYGCIPIDG